MITGQEEFPFQHSGTVGCTRLEVRPIATIGKAKWTNNWVCMQMYLLGFSYLESCPEESPAQFVGSL